MNFSVPFGDSEDETFHCMNTLNQFYGTTATLVRAVCMVHFSNGVACVLLLYVLGKWCKTCRGPGRSFNNGAYLRFTWDLELDCWYKALVLMLPLPVLLMLWLVMRCLDTFTWESDSAPMLVCWKTLFNDFLTGGFYWVYFKDLLLQLCLNICTLCLAIKSLLCPKIQVHHWPTSVDQMNFKRSWTSLLSGSNDIFSSKLIDALWRAKRGQGKSLQNLLPDGCDWHDALAKLDSAQSQELDGYAELAQ